MNTIAFFNNKGGVGKTSLVYHLAWMYADLGLSVVAADLDPQANLTSMFIDEAVLNESAGASIEVRDDPQCLATLKHYRSLMPLAQEARKPMFFLKPSDGALGGHAKAVQECYKDFRALALTIAERCGVLIS